MSMRKALQVILAALSLTILGQSLYGQGQGRWIYLGEANVDGNADHDRIKIGRDDGRFHAIQIHVERAPIEFQRVVVHYGNGADEEIAIRNRIKPGGKTRAIDLRGRDRVIDSVELWYAKARYGSAKPKLRLFGLP
jgi:hypothetical protein